VAGVIVLDASVLIAHFDANDVHHDRANEVLLSVAEDYLGASSLTLAEVLVGPVRAGRIERAAAALRQLDIRAIAVNEETPVRLATLRVTTSLKLPDCCVLLAAETTAAAGIATFDDRLAGAAGRLGFTVYS
jgi:predicted nucleic acid-binding protein